MTGAYVLGGIIPKCLNKYISLMSIGENLYNLGTVKRTSFGILNSLIP